MYTLTGQFKWQGVNLYMGENNTHKKNMFVEEILMHSHLYLLYENFSTH